jgi:hypothetical protein
LSSSHEIAFVDILTDSTTPYLGFGAIMEHSNDAEMNLHKEATKVRNDLKDEFGVILDDPLIIPEELDSIVRQMWNSGWDPQNGNIDLFARDFGLVLIEAILALLGGVLIFRRGSNVNHLSIFWSKSKIEAFPFHKTLKCLLNEDGDSMTYFVRGLCHYIGRIAASRD